MYKYADLLKKADPQGKGINSAWYRQYGVDPSEFGYVKKVRGYPSVAFIRNYDSYSLHSLNPKSNGQSYRYTMPNGKVVNLYLRTSGTKNFGIDVTDHVMTRAEAEHLAQALKPMYTKAGVTEQQFIDETLSHNRMHFAMPRGSAAAAAWPTAAAAGRVGSLLTSEKEPAAIADMRAVPNPGVKDKVHSYIANQ